MLGLPGSSAVDGPGQGQKTENFNEIDFYQTKVSTSRQDNLTCSDRHFGPRIPASESHLEPVKMFIFYFINS